MTLFAVLLSIVLVVAYCIAIKWIYDEAFTREDPCDPKKAVFFAFFFSPLCGFLYLLLYQRIISEEDNKE